jgi:REP element-mobilizing transposase RayT
MGGSTYFVTFRSARGVLPEVARKQVLENILCEHGKRADVLFGVVMPDHVHLLIRPLEKHPGIWNDLSKILQGIKGVSGRKINQLLGTTGSVWQQRVLIASFVRKKSSCRS